MKRICGLLACLILAGRAAGQDVPATGPDATQATLAAPVFLTGGWFGARKELADRGILVGGFLQVDTSRNTMGGLRHDKTEVRYLLDLNVTWDSERAGFFHGGTAFLDFQNHDGPNVSATQVGDAQGFDSIDGAHFTQVNQFWYQQLLAWDRVRVKVGKIDSNTDFSSIEHGAEFLQSADSNSATVFPMVTYPDPAPGGEVFFSPDGHVYAGAGAFYSNQHNTFLNISGHPESIERASGGAFVIGEAGDRWTIGDGLAGHAAVGGWYHTGRFADLTGGETDGTGGVYGFLDQAIYAGQNGDGSVRDVGLFLTGGHAERGVSAVAEHVGAGICCTGVMPGRPLDIAGGSVNWARLGEIPGSVYNSECDVEGFYKVMVTRWLVLKPDVQWVRHPGGQGNDALVLTLRLEVDF